MYCNAITDNPRTNLFCDGQQLSICYPRFLTASVPVTRCDRPDRDREPFLIKGESQRDGLPNFINGGNAID
ncbi:hypothetical protein [Floridanema evergladense]|uniref:Uncharacterized protein n=1 Tax=Floridaenema evergladense BLCC-F167 TaxID=3153639 RepID=A0ABV4WFC2_9CYAN